MLNGLQKDLDSTTGVIQGQNEITKLKGEKYKTPDTGTANVDCSLTPNHSQISLTKLFI